MPVSQSRGDHQQHACGANLSSEGRRRSIRGSRAVCEHGHCPFAILLALLPTESASPTPGARPLAVQARAAMALAPSWRISRHAPRHAHPDLHPRSPSPPGTPRNRLGLLALQVRRRAQGGGRVPRALRPLSLHRRRGRPGPRARRRGGAPGGGGPWVRLLPRLAVVGAHLGSGHPRPLSHGAEPAGPWHDDAHPRPRCRGARRPHRLPRAAPGPGPGRFGRGPHGRRRPR